MVVVMGKAFQTWNLSVKDNLAEYQWKNARLLPIIYKNGLITVMKIKPFFFKRKMSLAHSFIF